ncbi:hypothetical protein EHQ12_16010 [Leptospira gomenensis]|uniref:Vanw family protein n=1 Tax=Leptospira gomenensis TaxID=2484974 RepID=A0A5F1YUW1_9LEPT|nr:VanW family protein [Leptospira gomenensis]TGK35101.1 hypothetical protein EHQ12_16010 [Leptospira gomenensis]TGK35222.1 hypothetical protein EHQ17_07215 [Leptospira gomenensis]TGK41083.1 hypothetical protein EHQ07_16975 [Leptospira gomenensis]TGK61313.1 hypothetical protein EHQ13_09655 [Leptospira gomenensis]
MNRTQIRTIPSSKTRADELGFAVKVFLLQGYRGLKNILFPVPLWKKDEDRRWSISTLLATSETPLWNPNDTVENRVLTAGKIENLRIVARKLNGVKVTADQVFSFWKQIGNPNLGQGFVLGREIREGCIVPSIAGGICQISNALYDVAVRSGFEILERHRHSSVIPGSLAEQNRDATVKWNYVDLRFRSPVDFRIEIEFNAESMIVQFRSLAPIPAANEESIGLVSKNEKAPELFPKTEENEETRNHPSLNDCYSCGKIACSRHGWNNRPTVEFTAWILDEVWPEFDEYVRTRWKPNDSVIVPMKNGNRWKTNRFDWSVRSASNVSSVFFPSLWRIFKLRYLTAATTNRFRLTLELDRIVAQAAARRIPFEASHLVVSQTLLPVLWEAGVFAGRTFDVLMTRLPFYLLHERLNQAHTNHPQSETLNDFRASEHWIQSETQALAAARNLITPHAEIANRFSGQSILLEWFRPEVPVLKRMGTGILFPGSALGRKGAYEMKRLAEENDLSIFVLGNAVEREGFWENVTADPFRNSWEEIGLVVYPTYVEHQPRQLLKAISLGIPVITTTASGLTTQKNVTVLPVGDYESLKREVRSRLGLEKETPRN